VNFLDSGYYLLFLVLFGWLAVAVVRSLRAAPAAPALSPDETLSIPDGASRHLVRTSDLLRVRADDDYSVVTLTDGRELLSTANLAALIRLAPAHLLRIHRSHAINPAHIVATHRSGKSGPTVELQGGERLPIGRTYRTALDEWAG
jgi:DNA-binding LytR/AlgR family response regulator